MNPLNNKNNTPEITLKALILSIILTILLAASNAYLGLKVGVTVAASIPAAVISLAVFRFFKNSSVLESNLVQTSASAGESIACATVFVLPALLIVHFWQTFPYWECVLLLLLGGLLGVLFSVPLRRPLLNLKNLTFPEGTAIGNVLKVKAQGDGEIKQLAQGGIVSAIIALCQTGFKLITDHLPLWFSSGKTLFGYSLGFNPVLVGAGYIIGINASIALAIGSICGWIIGVPIMSHIYPATAGGNAEDLVMTLWSHHIRYMGVGTLLVAGVWTLCLLSKMILNGLVVAVKALKASNRSTTQFNAMTERDLPTKWVVTGIVLGLIILFALFIASIKINHLPASSSFTILLSLLSVAYVLILGFITALVGGYLVGLIGSTCTPLSGLIILNILFFSVILFPFAAFGIDLTIHLNQQIISALIIMIVGIISAITVVTLENIQDLKAGQMVGATPWKQQIMMAIGVLVSALVVPVIMNLLFHAYGMGGVAPHPGMDPDQMLPAPQASLVAALSQAFINHTIPWHIIGVGALIGLAGVILDIYLRTRFNKTISVLAIGLGIYLPPELASALMIGGLISYFGQRRLNKKLQTIPTSEQPHVKMMAHQRSLLLACGYVAGAALVGVILAVPFIIMGSSDALRLVSDRFNGIANLLGLIGLIGLSFWLYKITIKTK